MKKGRGAHQRTGTGACATFGALVVVACGKVYDEEPPPAPAVVVDASSDINNNSPIDSATQLTDATTTSDAFAGDTGLYYGACLSELAGNQPSRVFNLYATVTFSVDTLNMGFQFLAVVNGEPPTTVTKLGVVGPPHSGAAVGDTAGDYKLMIGTMEIPASANPIYTTDAQIDGSAFTVRWIGGTGIGSRFCGRLSGMVVKPAIAIRTLAPEMNICQFVPITEGATTPRFTAADLSSSGCPRN